MTDRPTPQTIREELRRQGVSGAMLDAAMLVYKIENDLPPDDAAEAEAMAEARALAALCERDTSGSKIN